MKWVNNAAFKKNILKNTCRYHYQNLDDMIYSSWNIEQNKLKMVILGHFLPFIPLKAPRNQNFEKWKNVLKISSFYMCAPKMTIIWCTVPEIWSETDKKKLSFWAIFCPFTTPTLLIIPNTKILKKMKKMLEDIIVLYTHVHHKWRSYDIWFLKYKVQQKEIFNILGHFLPFQPPDNLENQNSNIEKNTWRYYQFHTFAP